MKVFKKKKRGVGGLGIKEKKEDPCLPSPFSQLVAAVLLLCSGFQRVSLGLPRLREQNLVLPLRCTPQCPSGKSCASLLLPEEAIYWDLELKGLFG